MKQTQRHNGIIELVKQQGYVSTEELVEHFSVSPQTIRRDLNELAEQNLILRHHGGAALPSSSVNTPWHDRKATQTEEKERIARKVAEQIPNGSTLFIDIGTTPEAVAHALLNHSNLRIVTNNLNVANTLMVKEDFRIILAGGELRSRDGGIIGEATLDFISQFRLDFGILGISGIDSDGSLLEFDYHEVRTKRAIIENSRHVMLVVDHSKFGRNAMVNMGSISMVDAVYTDTMPPASVIQLGIYFFESPGKSLTVLAHLQSGGSNTACVGCLARAEQNTVLLEVLSSFHGGRHVGTLCYCEYTVSYQLLCILQIQLVLGCAGKSYITLNSPYTMLTVLLLVIFCTGSCCCILSQSCTLNFLHFA